MTANEAIPVFINTTQSIVAMMGNAEVFNGISLLEIFIGFACFTVIGKFVIWLRNRGGNSEGGNI